MSPDLRARWEQHVNEYFAAWGIPEDLYYAPGAPGEEPSLVLDAYEARCYAAWLKYQGYISKAEFRWLWEDIARQAGW